MTASQTVVIDTSVFASAVFGETHADAGWRVLEGPYKVLAPDWLRVEFASVKCKQVRLGAVAVDDAPVFLDRLDTLGVTYTPNDSLLRSALDISIAANHSLYDCLFVALARVQDCPLATADRKLAGIAGQVGGVMLWHE